MKDHTVIALANTQRPPWRVRARIALTRWSMVWERLWPAILPAALVVGLFAALALADVLPSLPYWLHVAILIVFGIALAASLVFAVRRFRWPSRDEAKRRLETASGALHRPLTTLQDVPALGGDSVASRTLWMHHWRRAAAALGKLRTPLPKPDIPRRDPYAVRAVVVLLLAVAVLVGGTTANDRFARAVTPTVVEEVNTVPLRVDIWISPPQYTRLAPIYFDSADADAISAPMDSQVLAQVHGVTIPPTASFGDGGAAFERIGESSYKAEFTLTESGTLTVSNGAETLATWDIEALVDQAPTVTFAEAPDETERHALKVMAQATDDYGLVAFGLQIALDAENLDLPAEMAERIDLPIPLPSRAPDEIETTRYHDLTSHVWAGVPVQLRLYATDALGNTGYSEIVSMVLPEREFTHPVARAIIEQRKILVIAPEERMLVAENLDAIAEQTDEYAGDYTVYMALKMARSRLSWDRMEPGGPMDLAEFDPDGSVIESTQKLLWDTARFLEDGGLALAEQELRDLQQQLSEALQNGASEEEIQELIEELREAMQEYLQELAENMPLMTPEQYEQLQLMMPENPDDVFSSQELMEMLEQLRELSESGATEQAQDLLSQLQEMMENMQPAPFSMPEQFSEQMEMMNSLNDLVQEQQQLLDETYRSSQHLPGVRPMPLDPEDPEGMAPPREPGELGEDQGDLRRDLGELMREFGDTFGEIPDNLGMAERAMRDAEIELDLDMPGEAMGYQQEALDQLQEGMQQMAEMMAQQGMMRFGQNMMPMQPGQGPRPAQRDPLGRAAPEDRGLDTGDVDLPDEAEIKRAREILEELRRRAGEAFRPLEELDYIERLLRRF